MQVSTISQPGRGITVLEAEDTRLTQEIARLKGLLKVLGKVHLELQEKRRLALRDRRAPNSVVMEIVQMLSDNLRQSRRLEQELIALQEVRKKHVWRLEAEQRRNRQKPD